MTKTHATQKITKERTRARAGRASRSAPCPKHKKDGRKDAEQAVSRSFVGVNEHGWIFHCIEGDHYFVAAPDAGEP